MKTAQNNMAVVNLNYTDLVLPVDDACALIKIMQKAQRFEEIYKRADGESNGKTHRYLGGDIPSVSMRILEAHKYQEALNNGERPQGD